MAEACNIFHYMNLTDGTWWICKI